VPPSSPVSCAYVGGGKEQKTYVLLGKLRNEILLLSKCTKAATAHLSTTPTPLDTSFSCERVMYTPYHLPIGEGGVQGYGGRDISEAMARESLYTAIDDG